METSIRIFMENDYSKFRFMPSNRDVSSNKQLVKSIMSCDVTPFCPILVDKDMRILDGQHRFDACVKLGKPVYYVVYEGDEAPEDVMVALNTCVKIWRQEEWIEYYSKKGVPSYVKFVEMSKLYNLGVSNNVLLFSCGKSNSRDVKKGRLTDCSDYWKTVYEFVMGIEHPKRFYRAFVNALMNYFVKYGSDKRMVSRLRKRIVAVPNFSNTDDYFNSFVNLSK